MFTCYVASLPVFLFLKTRFYFTYIFKLVFIFKICQTMHFTFTDSAVECACLVFVLCIIGLFSFKLVDLWTDYKEYKEVGLKLDCVFAAQVILLLAMVFAVVYLVWINPITITISR